MWGSDQEDRSFVDRRTDRFAPHRPDQEEDLANMRISRVMNCLLILVSSLAGCSQTGPFRPAGSGGASSGVKTVASVGDQPLPIVAGGPGNSVRADDDAPPPPSTVGSRVSGRVYNERGKPVPGASVRLAVGGASGGKVVSATTDRSGAFTLHGLRTGSSVTLIAEYDDGVGTMTGRAQVKAPQTDVRIALSPGGDESESNRASIRPAGPRVEPISNVDPVDEEPARDAGQAGRINFEDMGPPAAEAASLGAPENVKVTRAAGSAKKPSGRTIWSSRDGSTAKDAASPPSDADNDARSTTTPAAAAGGRGEEFDDEREDPLPPALEPTKDGAAWSGRSQKGDPVRVARNTPSSQSAPPRRSRSVEETGERSGAYIDDPADHRPRTSSAETIPGARLIKPGAYGPITIDEEANDAGAQAPASRRPRAAGSSSGAAPDSNATDDDPPAAGAPAEGSASAPRRPTWGELAGPRADVPLDESLRRASNNAAAAGGQVITLTSATANDQPQPPLSRLFGGARPKRDDAIKQSVCRIDPTERRLIDFRLPGLDGQWISLRDIDADVILLDFWGSWCAPCRTSTAHLIELQSQLAGKRFQVIGIACEPGATPEERQTRAAKAAKELGINYPVLVSTKGGSCPVQKALQVQFYPTLVLLDGNGRILAREHGATDATIVRIDRAIAQASANKGSGAVSRR
jgi:thiol-disulfide isomerase/thioredoxin